MQISVYICHESEAKQKKSNDLIERSLMDRNNPRGLKETNEWMNSSWHCPCCCDQRGAFLIIKHHTVSPIHLIYFKKRCLTSTTISWPNSSIPLISAREDLRGSCQCWTWSCNSCISSSSSSTATSWRGNKRSWDYSSVRVLCLRCCWNAAANLSL